MTDSNVIKVLDNAKSKKSGRPKKEDIYQAERAEVLNKLLKVLNINDNNKVFFVEEIENDKNKKDQILALKDDAKKYFNSYNWSVFHKNPKNQWLPLSKSILKASNKKMTTVYEMNDKCKNINQKGYKVI
jgi:hypothetical protein